MPIGIDLLHKYIKKLQKAIKLNSENSRCAQSYMLTTFTSHYLILCCPVRKKDKRELTVSIRK